MHLSKSLAFAKGGVSSGLRSRTGYARASHVQAMAAKRALVPVANGSEEMEAVIMIDVLRRAGTEVTVASVESTKDVTCSRGVRLVADRLLEEVNQESFDLIALPGGMPGAERLGQSTKLVEMLKKQRDAGKLYAAICATPGVVFTPAGLLEGKKATAHPAFVERLADQSRAEDRVVVDGTCTTSRGPGTAFEFALSLVGQLHGEDKAREVAKPMVL